MIWVFAVIKVKNEKKCTKNIFSALAQIKILYIAYWLFREFAKTLSGVIRISEALNIPVTCAAKKKFPVFPKNGQNMLFQC
jgi:hypothetical protein